VAAGVPGAGIGGVFYLMTALAMPIVEAVRTLRRRRDPASHEPRWGLALGQAGIALGTLAAVAAVGWLLASLVPEALAGMRRSVPQGGHSTVPGASNVLRAGALLISLVSLTAVVGSVEVIRLLRHLLTARGVVDPATEEPSCPGLQS